MQFIAPVNKMQVTEFSILLFEGAAHSLRVFLACNEAQKENKSFGGLHSLLDFHRN